MQKVLLIILSVLIILLLLLEIFGLRVNMAYFKKCDTGGEFGNIVCDSIPLLRNK